MKTGSADWNERASVQDAGGQAGGRAEHGPPLLDTKLPALPGRPRPENGPSWSLMSCFRRIPGVRWSVAGLEADVFCNLDGHTHTHTDTHTRACMQ